MLRFFVLSALFVSFALPACAQREPDSKDHVSLGRNITVDDGGTSGDIACGFCTVRLHGDTRGDIAVLFGRVLIDPGQSVSGDIAVLGGELVVPPDSTISGDVAVVAGTAHISPEAHIDGNTKVVGGPLWLLLLLIPLAIAIGFVWLIVILVRRLLIRRPY